MSSIDRTERNRLIVLASIAGVLLIAVVIALVAYLQRSVPTAAPAPSSTQAPAPEPETTSAAPTPTATTPAPAEKTIAMTTTGFAVSGPDVDYEHTWGDPADAALAALTELFGAAPEEDFVNGDNEHWAYDIYVWDGFRFYDVFLSEGARPRDQIPAPTYAAFTAGGDETIEFETALGLSVGDSAEDVLALDPAAEVALPDGGTRYVFGPPSTFYQDGARDFRAYVVTNADGAVTSITYSSTEPLG